MRPNKPELLMPAGSPQVFKIAVTYGADAVYVGGDQLSLRAKAGNFSVEEMTECIAWAHERGVKVYVAANVFARDTDIETAKELLPAFAKAGADGFIISDPGMFRIAREYAPEVEVHISTQANNTNSETWKFWNSLGVKRLVAARELSIDELTTLHNNIPEDMEIEAFIHGAMCISYSGRCLISSCLTGRDANRGACTHPCRWEYALVEKSRPGQYLPVEEDEKGTYLYYSKDLCMIEHIPELINSGVCSFKVEGRMKTALYVACVARAYRKAIDDWYEDPAKYEASKEWYMDEVLKCTARDFCTGFFLGQPGPESQGYSGEIYDRSYTYLGYMEKDENGMFFRQKNKFLVGDVIEIMRPDGTNTEVTVRGMKTAEGENVESCPHPGQIIYPDFGIEVNEFDILCRKN